MKINLEQLPDRCQTQWAAGYWLAGDEILLQQEATDLIRTHAKQAGFSERNVFYVDQAFDWTQVQDQQDNLSLFSEKKLIELHLSQIKLGDAGRKSLLAFIEGLNADTCVLICSPKVDTQTQKAKWVQTIIKTLDFVPIWPVNSAQYPAWLKQRSQKYQLNLAPEAVRYLADQTQGHLLAADQALQHLQLLYPGETINQAQLTDIVQQSQQSDLFTLADSALAGQSQQVVQQLHHLKAQGSEPILILWALTRELRSVNKILLHMQQGQNSAQAMQRERIWASKQAIMRQALQRLTQTKIHQLIQSAAMIDLQLKGVKSQDPWQDLTRLVLDFASA